MQLRILPLALVVASTLALGACSAEDDQQAETDAGQTPAREATLGDKAKKLAEDAKDLGSSTWEATKETTGELVESGKQAVDSAADATGEAVDTVKEKSAAAYDAAKEKGAAAYDAVKEKSAAAYDTVKEKAADAIDAAKERMDSEEPQQTAPPPAAPQEI
jgi:hypothetical protein